MQVQGQAAIVTGGGSGLGAGTARVLAAAGAKVALFDVNEEGAQKVAAEIGGIAVRCDVADAGSAEAAFATARDAHGPARILVNCAGIAPAERIVGRNGPMPLDNFRKVIEVNLIGTFNMIRLAAADMQGTDPLEDGERGFVISTASVAAREFAKVGIRFNTIAPGLFGTPMLLGMPEDVQNSLAATVPYPSRFGTPEEYAKLAMAMIDNVMLNGETVRLDGAIRMQPR